MDQKPNGPYKHVERPSKSRSIDDEQQDNRGEARAVGVQ